MLREAGIEVSQGKTVVGILESFGVSEVTYYRWRREYGRMTVAQARGLSEVEREAPSTGQGDIPREQTHVVERGEKAFRDTGSFPAPSSSHTPISVRFRVKIRSVL